MKNNKGFNFWTVDSLMHLNYVLNTLNKVEDRFIPLDSYYQKPGIITDIPDIINEYIKERKK